MNQRLFENFTNQFTLSKSLSFQLIPQGKTLEYLHNDGILDIDKRRNEDYQVVRRGIDDYHREFIDNALSSLRLTGLNEYHELYQTPYKERSDAQKKRMFEIETYLRKQVAQQLRSNDLFHVLFSKELISEVLPEYFADNQPMLNALESFDGFTTYFKNFHTIREAMYSDEKKASSIANRIVHDNLPKFIVNMDVFGKVLASPVCANICEIEKWIGELTDTDGIAGIVENMFRLDHFSATATQSGIENYNLIISGYSDEDGIMHKGLNSYINEYNQTVGRTERLPLLVPLYKQLLAHSSTVSFVPDRFESDQEVLDCIKDFYTESKATLKKQELLVNSLEEYDLDRIFIKNDSSINDISLNLYGNWDYIRKALHFVYDKENRKRPVRNEEKYIEKRRKHFNKIGSFSISELNDALREYAGEVDVPVQDYFKTDNLQGVSSFMLIDDLYDDMGHLMTQPYPSAKNLKNDKGSIKKIKAFLDALKDWQKTIKPLCGSANESEKDDLFYGQFDILWSELFALNGIYNKVRNYITKKVTTADKIKLNFSNSQLGGGWSVGVERDKGCLLFKDVTAEGREYYYLGVINKESRNMFKEYPQPKDSSDAIFKVFYYQSADPTKSIMNLMVIDGETRKINGRREKSGPHAGENIMLEEAKNTYLPDDVNRIRLNRAYSKRSEHFSDKDLQTYINYYRERIKEYMPEFDFGSDFDSLIFTDWNDFTAYIKKKAYQVPLREISKSWLYERVEKGDLYLFQIYNVDFNPNRKGKKKITTRYFEMLFNPANFENGAIYKLNGGAEIFYRPAALDLKDTAIHVKGVPIQNKNPLNDKKESVFDYNIVKNNKSTKDIFILNCSIECNFSADENEPLNIKARKAIRENDATNVMIGVSRGENHLLYYSVVDENGNILEQKSLNVIDTISHSGDVKMYDYNASLEEKESERENARLDWQDIDSIKNMKEGYLSQVIWVLYKLMLKYNACIAVEDISSSFKSKRQKIEKNVYSKFDTALVNKLSFLIDKDMPDNATGGLLKALQLAAPEKQLLLRKDNQNGFLFYVQPAYTTSMDPTTGFASMLGKYLTYSNANDAVLFVRKLDSIKYNNDKDFFEIELDYAVFGLGEGTKTDWTICTAGKRTKVTRNERSARWQYDVVDLTMEFKALFKDYDIDISGDIQKQLLEKASPRLLKNFMELFKLTMQMRNMIDGEYHIVSPVQNENGDFYNTHESDGSLPVCAAANSAYNIAQKGLLYIDMIKAMNDDDNSKLIMRNVDWLTYMQNK